MIAAIGAIFKIIGFFIGLWKERDEEKAKEKAEAAKEIVDVFKETDKRRQASRLVALTTRINRM